MALSQGGKIQAADYNSIRTNFMGILSTGSGTAGYNATPLSSSVPVGQKVKEADWDNLRRDIQRLATHQGTSITSLTNVGTSDKVSVGVANQYNSVYTTLYNNRLNIAAGQYSDESLTTSTRTANWNGSLNHAFNLNFGSYNAARGFFNAGGQIRIQPSFSRSSNTTINLDWDSLINNVPTLVFNYTETRANSTSGTLISSTGFFDLTSAWVQLYTRTGGIVSGASGYTANDYTVRVRGDSATPSIVYFECQFNDDKGFIDPLWPQGDEPATGTTTNTVRMYRPTETTSNAGIVCPAPSVSVTSNL